MSGTPAYHGWTHRPKAQGGTDPIDVLSYIPPSAIADGFTSNQTLTGSDLVTFKEMWRTSADWFTPHGGNAASFQFIDLVEDGFYQADFTVEVGTLFSGSDNPFIEPACQIAGTPDTLVNSVPIYFSNTANWIGGEQLATSEYAHYQLYARALFNYTAADVDPSFGVGVRLKSQFSGTKTLSGSVAVTRLGDALEEVT